MDTKTDLEQQYKKLQELNRANIEENIRAQTKLDEGISRIKNLVNDSTVPMDITIDFDKLSNKDYVNNLLEYVNSSIEQLQNEFKLQLDAARKELGQ